MSLFEQLGEFARRILVLLRREKFDAELDEEIRLHRELRERELAREGAAVDDARYAAQRRFGNSLALREQSREMWGWRWLEDFAYDLRFGARMLAKNPGFTAIVVLTLALGIGANAALFSVVDAVLIHPFPYFQPDRIVFLRGAPVLRSLPNPQRPLETTLEPAAWLSHTRSLESVALYESGEVNLSGGDRPERVRAAEVTTDFFSLMGVVPYGHAFFPEESAPGRDQVAVLSEELCRRFGAPSDVLGRSLAINGKPFTIVGVMPAGFQFPGRTQIWLPLPLPWTFENDNVAAGSGIIFSKMARLHPGVSVAQTQDEVIGFAAAPPGNLQEARDNIHIIPLPKALLGDIEPILLLLLGAVAFVLLIACADVANMLLARAVARQKEIALRAALGASRSRILRQNLTESILLSCLGCALGLLLAGWSVGGLRVLVPSNMPMSGAIQLDWRVVAFTLGVSLVSGILFGLFPALHAFRVDLNQSLKEGGVSASAGRGSFGRARFWLAISEVALTLILLTGAGLLLKSFWRLAGVDPGFNAERLMTAHITLQEGLYQESAPRVEFYREVLRRASALPGVRAAAFTSDLPLSGRVSGAVKLEVKEPSGTPVVGDATFALYSSVSPDYFRVMRLPLLAGRAFTDADRDSAPNVAIVSASLAKVFWPGENPLGKHVKFPNSEDWLEIIGVVGDTRHFSLAAEPSEDIYMPIAQDAYSGTYLVVGTAGDPALIAGAVRQAVAEVDCNEPLSDFSTMEERVSRSMSGPRFRTTLLGIFAALALVLAAAGIFGVISYWASQRTREIGIRVALGAESLDVLRLVLGQGMRLAGIGIAIGLAGGLAVSRYLASLLFGVTSHDPLTFVGVTLVLAGVSVLACWVPARRAARVDPLVALRHE